MANTNLTVDIVTKESLRVLHNNLVFIRGIDRQFDDDFVLGGSKGGNAVRIRLPDKFTVRTGEVMDTQDVDEQQVTLTKGTMKGIDMIFTDLELTLDIDEFSRRKIQPAMSKLATMIDLDAMSMVKDIYNHVGTAGTTPATAKIYLDGGAKLDDNAAPMDDQRRAVINPAANASIVDALKGLFQQSEAIASQYRMGKMGTALGFDFARTQNIVSLTTGDHAGTVLTKGASTDGDSTIDLDGYTNAAPTLKKGDVFTISSVNMLNPDNEASTGNLQQFVVTADLTGSGNETLAVAISPTIRTTGALKNVDAVPADGATIAFLSGNASSTNPINILHHKDAFAIAFTDLTLPRGVQEAAKSTKDGITMRLISDYDIINGKYLTRLDVHYGFKTIRPELACRLVG